MTGKEAAYTTQISDKVNDANGFGSSVANDLVEIKSGSKSAAERWFKSLNQPVDGASLGVYRLCFGLIMLLSLLRFSPHIFEFATAKYHFSYAEYIPSLTVQAAPIAVAILAFSAANVCLGLFHRVSSILLCAGSVYLLLWDKTYYQNQIYLVSILSFLLALVPANRVLSIDNADGAAPQTVPRWSILVFRLQLAIIFAYVGISYINSDWINGFPQFFWILRHSHDKVFGPLLHQPWSNALVTYGGIALNLAGGLLLLFRRTRVIGAAFILTIVAAGAHALPKSAWPWLVIATLTLYLPPSWPRLFTKAFKLKQLVSSPDITQNACQTKLSSNQKFVLIAVHVFVLIQILVPLKQFFYPLNSSWSDLGNRFCWSLAFPGKRLITGEIKVTDNGTHKTTSFDARKILATTQYASMFSHPDLLLQFAHYIARTEREQSGKSVAVRIKAVESLNERAEQDLIDSNVDLTKSSTVFSSPDWLIPLRSTKLQ